MERIRFNIPTCIDRFSPRHVGLDVYVYINKSIDIDIDINIYIYTDICHDIPIRFFVLQYGRESPDKLMNPTTIPMISPILIFQVRIWSFGTPVTVD